MAHPSTTLYAKMFYKQFLPKKNYNYRTKEKPTEQRIERKQGTWG